MENQLSGSKADISTPVAATISCRRCIRVLLCGVTLAGAAFSVDATQREPSDTMTVVRRPGEVTVTARTNSRQTLSQLPLQQITGAEIRKLGIADMADAVRRFAGVNVRDYGGIGGLKTVSVRNMGASHTAVSYDGAPVSNCQGGQIDISRFSLDNVEMLSLAVGQNTDMLQPARLYASAAVLGITTARPEFDSMKRAQFRVQLKGGSFGYVDPSVRWWQPLGAHVTTALNGEYLRADGNYPFTLKNGKYTTRERRNNSAIDSWHAEANVYVHPDTTDRAGNELQLKIYGYGSKRGIPGAVTLYNPVSTETLWDRNAFLQIRYRRDFGTGWQMQALAKYNYSWNRDRETGNRYEGGVYMSTHRQHEYYLSATAMWRPGNRSPFSFALAQDGIVNTLWSTMSECPFPKRFTSLTALTARWGTRTVRATATLTATHITEHVRQGEHPDDLNRLNPSVSVSIQPWSDRMLFVRAMYKNTFRAPSFNDLYYDRLGNRSLRPEKASEYNLGLTWSGNAGPLALSASGDFYYNTVRDKIVAFPTTYVWRMVNFGKVHSTGFDATLAATMRLPAGMSATLSGSYTWQRAIDLSDPESKSYRDQLPYTPRNNGSVSLVVDSPWATLGYSMVAVGKRYFLAQNVPDNEIAGYTDHSLSLSRNQPLGKTMLTLRAEVINLTDRQYDVIKYYPMPGRSWRLTATWNF